MPIDLPQSDTSRSIQHDPSQDWPTSVKIQVMWRDTNGRPLLRTEVITADAFFGRGKYGAPIEGQALLAMIERMRRQGPPVVVRKRLSK